jgi:hypothetical protein
MPNIPQGGTKSRVETQIRMVFDLASAEPLSGGGPYNRVGSWRWLKLPKGTSTKKRARKAAKIGQFSAVIVRPITDTRHSSCSFRHSQALSGRFLRFSSVYTCDQLLDMSGSRGE